MIDHLQDPPELVIVRGVRIGDRLRPLDADKVAELAESIEAHGLLSPIVLRDIDDGSELLLVCGLHRLEAVKRLGWKEVPAVFVDCDEDAARMIEITENLHRTELTVIERAEQTTEYVRLEKAKREKDISAQAAQKLKAETDANGKPDNLISVQVAQKSKSETNPKGAGRNEGGLSAVARDLGLTREEIRRSEKIASIAPEAKVAAIKAGLGDNQSALLKIAKEPAKTQVKCVETIKTKKGGLTTNRARYAAKCLFEYLQREHIPAVLTFLEDIPSRELVRAVRARMKKENIREAPEHTNRGAA